MIVMLSSRCLHRLLASAGCLTWVCCADGLYKDLAREQSLIAAETVGMSTSTGRDVMFSWDQAVERLLGQEIGLRQAESRLAELRRQRKSQWREWLPRPTFYVNLQNSLRELGDFSGDDISAAVYAPLTIPNPWSQTAKAYQNALMEVQATDSLELNRRRQVISLYRVFSDWESMVDASGEGSGFFSIDEEVQAALRSMEREIMAEERRQLVQAQLGRMLNLPGVNVIPRPGTLPRIDYESKLGRLVPGKNYAALATRIASYELQAAILRRKGYNMIRWPEPNLSTSLPAVYDSRRNESRFIESGDDIALFGSWSKSVDLTGREAAGIESAEENLVFVRESIRLKLDAEARNWNRLKSRYSALLERRNMLRERLAAVLGSASGGGSADESVAMARRLLVDLEGADRAKRDLDMEIWLWDDESWK